MPAVVLRSATARDAGADTGVFLAECVTWLATDADGSLAGCAARRGSGNEEGLPDLRYGWPPPGPAR